MDEIRFVGILSNITHSLFWALRWEFRVQEATISFLDSIDLVTTLYKLGIIKCLCMCKVQIYVINVILHINVYV